MSGVCRCRCRCVRAHGKAVAVVAAWRESAHSAIFRGLLWRRLWCRNLWCAEADLHLKAKMLPAPPLSIVSGCFREGTGTQEG